MNKANSKSISAVLADAHPEHSERLPVRVVANDSAISIFPEGYGDFGSADGHGCPLFIELYEGRLRLIAFADINQQDPSIIDLEAAREDQRIELSERTRQITPLQEGRRYYEMLSQTNPEAGKLYTMKKAAAALGVEYARFGNLAALWQTR